MTLRKCIIASFLAVLLAGGTAAQRASVLAPDGEPMSTSFAERLIGALSKELRVQDPDVAAAAFRSMSIGAPYNLTADQARDIGAVLGTGHFILVKAAAVRRSSFAKPEYYEAYAAVYLVNSRTGLLDLWKLETYEAATPKAAEAKLFDTVDALARQLGSEIVNAKPAALNDAKIETFDPDAPPNPTNPRPPMPYRRIKPEYTLQAFSYGISATIEALVDIGADGGIQNVTITRWGGYGLDESVEKTIRAMNWRAGERGGRPLPMRILLRYNFRKTEDR